MAAWRSSADGNSAANGPAGARAGDASARAGDAEHACAGASGVVEARAFVWAPRGGWVVVDANVMAYDGVKCQLSIKSAQHGRDSGRANG